MSTFLERRLGTSGVTCLCWKQTSPSYLAVGTSSGTVEFFWSDCTACNFPNLSYQSRTSQTQHVTSLTFHPMYDILITFWSDGVMRSWNCEKGTISSQMSPHSVKHNSDLKVLFNQNGTRLISTDYRGVVSIWKCTSNGALNLLYTFKLKYGCSNISVYHHMNEEISAFYMSNNEGKIYLATDDGHCNDILQLDDGETQFRLLQYITAYNKLIFITQDMTLYLYDVSSNDMNALSLNKSIKLCIKSSNVDVICVYLFDAFIAIANEQSVVQIFNVIHNDNYILSLTDSRHMAAPNDTVDQLKFIQSTKVLIGITCKNRIALWKYTPLDHNCSEKDWCVLPPIALTQNIAYIDSGSNSHFYNSNDIAIAAFLAKNTSESSNSGADTDAIAIDGELKVFCETKLHYKYSNGYTFIQFAPNRLSIYISDDKMKKIRTPFTILIVANAGNLVFLSNGEQAQLYKIEHDNNPIKIYEWDEMLCSSAAIHLQDNERNNIIVCYHHNIRIYSCNGSLKTTLTFQPYEGFPISLDLNASILAVVTTENILKVWDLSASGTNMKAIIPQRKLDEYMIGSTGVQSIRLNATSNKISILSFAENNINSTLYIYDIEKDECNTFEVDENLTIEDVIWEQTDGRFLSILWKKLPSFAGKNKENADNDSSDDNESDSTSLFDASSEQKIEESCARVSCSLIKTTRRESMLEMTDSESENVSEVNFGVISFFIAPDGKILPQEMFPTKWRFVGLEVPNFIFISATNVAKNGIPKVIRKRIRDFIGINNIDENIKQNLMNFSYFLTVGELDEAYRSVQNIKSSSVWENMARMCVKTRRLDVAQICISNLSSSRGTSARVASSLFFDSQNENDADDNLRLAMVAIDLKMYDDAEELLKQCEPQRYDLIVKLYQALGRWMSAIEICEKHDRVNLNGALYKYANYLQECGKVEDACEFYEKSDCYLKIAQMLFQQKHLDILQKYVENCKDVKLSKWYAQYLESNENYNGAIPFYERANDYVSIIRLCCEVGDIEKAESIVNKSKSLGSAFHLASYYEDNNDIQNAIKFYKQSKAYHHALRLAKEHELDEMLVDIALITPDSVLTQRSNPKEIAAKYFYDSGDFNKAVMLYEKAGNINAALDVCIEAQLFDRLRNIASSLTETKSAAGLDPNVALRFSQYFLKYQQYEKAVSMLIIAKQYDNALSIISSNGVRITSELAEQLTPAKHANMSASEVAEQKNILRNLAKCLTEQQQYQLACKKYTQCGDKIEAIKCLIKGGDTKKVIYYASKTKKGIESHDANILAANYLQSLDWFSNPQYTKYIQQFYNSAKAYQQLAFFYDAMAQIEIDDYRDYDKALRALKQAYKQIKKSTSKTQDTLRLFEQRISLVSRFSSARKLAESDPKQMIKICDLLVQETDLEGAIRVGDVYALLVEYYHSIENMNEAYDVIQRMSANNIRLEPYLDATMIENIYNAVGVDTTALPSMMDEDVVEEDIVHEII